MSPFTEPMLKASVYKRTQGKIARQVTAIAVAVLLIGALFQIQTLLTSLNLDFGVKFLVTTALGVIFLWFSYRVVNYPKFADFLIQVEAEMRKVSWPSWHQVVTSSCVVIVVMLILMISLFSFDIILSELFQWMGKRGNELFQWMGFFTGT